MQSEFSWAGGKRTQKVVYFAYISLPLSFDQKKNPKTFLLSFLQLFSA